MTKEQVKVYLKYFWEQKFSKQTAFLDLENYSVEILASKELTDDEKIRSMKELIDAITRRGHFDQGQYL